MMYYPKLTPLKTTRTAVKSFGGIDNRVSPGDYTLKESAGVSPDAAPYIESMKTPKSLKSMTNGRVFYLGENYFLSGGVLYRGETDTGVRINTPVRSAVKMGEKAIFFPQKVYSDTSDHGSLENTCTYTNVSFTLCRKDGTDFSVSAVSGVQPLNPSDGDMWLDTSGVSPVLKRCTSGVYYSVSPTYIHIQKGGIGVGFKKGDGVKIEGSVLNGEYVIEAVENDRIIVPGILSSAGTGSATVSRTVPDINYAEEYANRIFGCAADGSAVYVSALGRPDGFGIFEGLSSDSYAADISDGEPFTAVKGYMGDIYFFKENLIYVLKGTKPANYRLSVIHGKGVKSGCERSLVSYGGVMYYYGTDGFYAFDGTYPEKVLPQLTKPLTDVSASVVRDTLYFSADEGFWGVNLISGVLYKISSEHYKDLLCECDKLYYCDGESYGDFTGDEGEFSLTFNEQYLTEDSEKAVTRINLSAFLGTDSHITVHIGYDGEEPTPVFSEDSGGGIIKIPVVLRPHRTLSLKISGKGKFRLYSLNVYRKETSPCHM